MTLAFLPARLLHAITRQDTYDAVSHMGLFHSCSEVARVLVIPVCIDELFIHHLIRLDLIPVALEHFDVHWPELQPRLQDLVLDPIWGRVEAAVEVWLELPVCDLVIFEPFLELAHHLKTRRHARVDVVVQ